MKFLKSKEGWIEGSLWERGKENKYQLIHWITSLCTTNNWSMFQTNFRHYFLDIMHKFELSTFIYGYIYLLG